MQFLVGMVWTSFVSPHPETEQLTDDRWAFPARPRPDLGQGFGGSDDRRQSLLEILVMLRRVGLVGLQVNPKRRPLRAGPGKPEDGAGTIVEKNTDALTFGHRAVDRVDIGKIVGPLDGETDRILAGHGRDLVTQMLHDPFSRYLVDGLVIMPRVEMAAIGGPMLAHHISEGLPAFGENVQP